MKCYIGTCLSLTAFGLFAVVCVIVTDHIYTALFSALVQTHCAHVAMWFWISDCILSQRSFVLIHRSSLLRALFGCYINCYINCHVKLRPSRRTFCVHHITMHQFTVHFLQSHIRRVHVCIAVTCYLHSCQKYLDLLRATAVTRGRNGYRIKSHHEKLILEKNIPAGDRTRDIFDHESDALITTELSPLRPCYVQLFACDLVTCVLYWCYIFCESVLPPWEILCG